jgi:hypothetical protein
VPHLSNAARRRLLMAVGRLRWDGSVQIVYAPEYRPLVPDPVRITPRWVPSRAAWELEGPAGIEGVMVN